MTIKKILVVEDEAVTALDLRSNLIELGYQVPAIAATGEDAVRLAAELHPDLILMDIKLDGPMNGIEAAATIREVQPTPIVYLTAHADAETIGSATRLSEPFGYLPKPCNLEALSTTIAMAIFKGEAEAERKKMEERLNQVMNEQRIILDNIGVGVSFVAERKILWANRTMEKMFGYSINEIEGKDTEMLYPDLETYVTIGAKGYAALSRGEVFSGEAQMKKKDGTLRWCNLVGQAVYPGHLEQGTIWIFEDVTEGKAMEAELVRARNLESLGVLVGGIAHDFNNLFQGLLGHLSLAKMCTPESSKAFKFLNAAERVYVAASTLTNQLLAFSTGDISIRTKLKPTDLMREAVVTSLMGSSLEVEFELDDNPWLIHADPIQLRQVVKHLMQNARDAMPSGGKVRVKVSNESITEATRKVATLAEGNYVTISIQDQGCGISKENLPRIFDPYFSTKQRGSQKGLGLGLPLCDTIIRKHGGGIKVETEQGRGTTFHIHIPAVNNGPGQGEATQGRGGHGPRILIMDDESGVVRVATKFLQLSGYRVDSAPNGEGAIDAYRSALEAGDPYAAVILDLSIPGGGPGGKEVVAILKEIDPQVKAIVSSGYANDPTMTDYAASGFVNALAKPYELKEMKEMLDGLI